MPGTPTRSRSRFGGLSFILLATVVGGVIGYLIQLLAPAVLSSRAYVAFSVFWSTVHLAGAALGGVQQELTRAIHPADGTRDVRKLVSFSAWYIGFLAVAATIFAVTLAPVVFEPTHAEQMVWLAVGVFSSFFFSLLIGLLYGLSMWPFIAALSILDVLMRGVFVTVAIVLQLPSAVFAAIVVPFGASTFVIWLAARKRISQGFRIDVSVRRLLLQSSGTVIAALAMGIIVTGLPMLIRLSLTDLPVDELAAQIAVITITRAPLIIPMLALSNFLIVKFRTSPVRSVLAMFGSGLVLLSVAGAIVGYLLAPPLIAALSAGRFVVSPPFAAAVVFSAGMVALLGLTGPALLSKGAHGEYVGGWFVTAVGTVVLLQLPIVPEVRIGLALIMPPVLGVLLHVVGLLRSARQGRDLDATTTEPLVPPPGP